jgi:hypothetical protein
MLGSDELFALKPRHCEIYQHLDKYLINLSVIWFDWIFFKTKKIELASKKYWFMVMRRP